MTTYETLLTRIAEKHLGLDTLETRHTDHLDFHDLAVWSIHDALEAAFKAGVEVGASLASVPTIKLGFDETDALRQLDVALGNHQ